MIGCAEAVHRLWAYLDATIGEHDRALVDEHLARCLRCCGELEFARELRRFLARCGRQDIPDIPDDVLRRLTETLEELGP
jgi:anti-sigma factor (TIGR02949 family)